jgi:hypothetical protein
VRPEGIEPPAYRFEACRSIHLSYGRASDRLQSVVHGARDHNIAMLESTVPRAVQFTRAGSSIGRAADS